MSSPSADSVASTLPRRTETLLERPRTATASAASAPAFLAASTKAATRSTSLEASTLLFMGFFLAGRNRGAAFANAASSTIYCSGHACAMGAGKGRVAATARPNALHHRPFNTGRWHGSGVTGDLFRSSAAARRRSGLRTAVQTHRPRHHSRLSRRRHRHRPGGAADNRRRGDPAGRRARHRLPAVHPRPRDQAVAAVGPQARDLRARTGAGRGHRRLACRPGAAAGRAGLAGRDDHRLRAGAVVDGFRDADPRAGRHDQHQIRPDGILGPAVPGYRHRSAAGAHSDAGAGIGGRAAARLAAIRHLDRRDRRVADRRALSHQSAVPHHRQYRRQGSDDRGGAARGDRVRDADAAGRPVDGDGRFRGRRDACRIAPTATNSRPTSSHSAASCSGCSSWPSACRWSSASSSRTGRRS